VIIFVNVHVVSYILYEHRGTKNSERRGSYYVNIPKELMKELWWKGCEKLIVRKSGGELVVENRESRCIVHCVQVLLSPRS